jgi:hypothetical protein
MGLTGSDLVAHALKRQGVDASFFLMGAPMLSVESAALALRRDLVPAHPSRAACPGIFRISRHHQEPLWAYRQ